MEKVTEFNYIKLPEYGIWRGMIQRCTNPKVTGYKNYGGRGIIVCDRWRENFLSFLKDMGKRPGLGYSIDRIDNDGHYEPGNCRWATQKQQANNTRRCKNEKVASGESQESYEQLRRTVVKTVKQQRVTDIDLELQRRIKATALSVDRNTFADATGKAYSTVAEILNTRADVRLAPTQFIAANIVEAPELFIAEVINYLLELVECEPAKKKPAPKKQTKTPEEQLAEIKKQIHSHGLEKLFDL